MWCGTDILLLWVIRILDAIGLLHLSVNAPSAFVVTVIWNLYYSQIFSGWVEVKASLPTGKLELLTLELHPLIRSWESLNPPAGS
jgi:hypothetical protein